MNKQIYTELYAVLAFLGKSYYTRIPEDFCKAIIDNADKNNLPILDKNKTIDEQNLSKETLAMVAMMKLYYWCNSEEEKATYLEKLQKNEQEIIAVLSAAISTRELLSMLKKGK